MIFTSPPPIAFNCDRIQNGTLMISAPRIRLGMEEGSSVRAIMARIRMNTESRSGISIVSRSIIAMTIKIERNKQCSTAVSVAP